MKKNGARSNALAGLQQYCRAREGKDIYTIRARKVIYVCMLRQRWGEEKWRKKRKEK